MVQFEIGIQRLHRVLPRARITLVETKKLLDLIKSGSSILRVQVYRWYKCSSDGRSSCDNEVA